MMKSVTLALAAAVLLGATAQAAQPPPAAASAAKPAPADPAKIALGVQLLEATHAKANALAYIELMMPSLASSLKARKPDVSPAMLGKFQQSVKAQMIAGLPHLLDLQARVLARHYSMDELKGLAAFYKSKLGQRMVEETPKVLKETVPIGQAWGRETSQDAIEKALAALRKQGVKI